MVMAKTAILATRRRRCRRRLRLLARGRDGFIAAHLPHLLRAGSEVLDGWKHRRAADRPPLDMATCHGIRWQGRRHTVSLLGDDGRWREVLGCRLLSWGKSRDGLCGRRLSLLRSGRGTGRRMRLGSVESVLMRLKAIHRHTIHGIMTKRWRFLRNSCNRSNIHVALGRRHHRTIKNWGWKTTSIVC